MATGGLVLALAAAVSFGTADFLGGLATRRSSALLAVLVAQLAGLGLVVPVVLLSGESADGPSLAWGMAAGVCGCVGLVVFFRALADGVMSAAAPITAVVSAGLPVLTGVLLGERPAGQAWLGVGAGLLAVAAISRGGEPGDRVYRGRALALAVAGGVGFGLFFVLLSRAPASSGLWPLVGARLGSLATLATLVLVVLARHSPWRSERAALRLAVVSGALDMTANALFLLAVHRGQLALVAVLVSLYPAATVLLALGLLRERLGVSQLTGIGLALLAAALIASS